MVITVAIAGLNLHQLLSSYGYVKEQIAEFRGFIEENESVKSVTVLTVLVYFLLPCLYFLALSKAQFFAAGLQIVIAKFVLSGAWAWWVQKRILSKKEYTPLIHFISKSDNIFNVCISAGVVYFLIFR